MQAFDYDTAVHEGEVYCTECLPDDICEDSDDVTPIFASDEWDYAPSCTECSAVHDYMSLIELDEE